jgi:hypothetical protein
MNDPAGATGGDVVGPSSATDNAIVRFDGTTGKLVQNSVVTIADSTGDISGVGQLNATTVDATNIEVTNIKAKDGTAAGSIADSTGVVSFTANPVMSGGTANGVLYLNGSKVATSGSALTFDGTNFAVGGVDSYNNKIIAKGVASYRGLTLYTTTASARPTISLINENTATKASYIQDSSAGELIFGQMNYDFGGHVEGMRLTSTGLGIGTSSPSASDWNASATVVQANKNDTNGGLFKASSSNTNFIFSAGNNLAYLATTTNTPITFWTNTVERMRLDASGNLDLATGKVTTSTAGTGAGFQWGGTTVTSRLYDDGSGNVYLDVGAGASNATVPLIIRTKGGSVAFNNGTSQTMTLDASGNLLVGTTSSFSGTSFYQAASGIYTSYFRQANASNPLGLLVNYSASAPNGTGNAFFEGNDNVAARVVLRSNGGIANYQANDVNLSDRREKTNFALAKSYLDIICAIPVQTFNYIDQNIENDGGLTLGVVAQDVQAVAPELVMESNWGTEENPKMRLSIYQTDLQYALMKCIQEQQALITSLTARVALLEGN